MRKFFEKIIESLFTISGFVTSIVIVLVLVFLFSGVINLFRSQAIEAGYVVAVHFSNSIDRLSPSELKDIFKPR